MRLTAAENRVEIIVGDCRDTLAALPEASVDCIVTSPPYYGLRDYGCDGQIGLEQTPEAYIAEIVGVMRLARRVLKPTGTLWLNLGDSYAATTKGAGGAGKQHTNAGSVIADRSWRVPDGCKPKDLLMIPASVAIALRADGWWLRSEIIWRKPNPMPESVRDRPTKAHEHVYLLAASERYFYDQEAIAERGAWCGKQLGIVRGKKVRAEAMGRKPSGNERPGADANAPEIRNARTVWDIPTEPCDLAHFALMPTELARRCILAGCPKGGVVLDPFGGGGTTGLTAARHGRRAILCELNPEYAEIARARIAREWREPERSNGGVDLGPLFADAMAEDE